MYSHIGSVELWRGVAAKATIYLEICVNMVAVVNVVAGRGAEPGSLNQARLFPRLCGGLNSRPDDARTAPRRRSSESPEAAKGLSQDWATDPRPLRACRSRTSSACSSAYIAAAWRRYTTDGGGRFFAPDPGSSPSTGRSSRRFARARTKP